LVVEKKAVKKVAPPKIEYPDPGMPLDWDTFEDAIYR